jgi:PAS domain S-box-containing protein
MTFSPYSEGSDFPEIASPDTGSEVLRHAELLRHLPLPAVITDASGHITFYNTEATVLWGGIPEPGKSKWESVSGKEWVIERPDGSIRSVIVHCKPLVDSKGSAAFTINLLSDVTGLPLFLDERVRAGIEDLERKNRELKQSEERYHKMISEVEDYAILLLDKDGIIQNWNIGAEKIKGYKESEVIGQNFRIFYTRSDREKGLPEKLIEEARCNGKAVHEGWRQRKDGTLFWGSIVITALHDEGGGIIGFSKVTRDLTARRVAEEKLRRYSADLEFQNLELQQFAYAAAHDMKEPLRKLRFYSTAAIDSLRGRLSPKEERYLLRSADAASRMQTLIDDLLAYSRTSVDGSAIGSVDLNQVVMEARQNYQDLIEETGATFEVNDLPVINGIAFQLRQLFENLLGNALKYRHSGRPPLIRITCEENITYSPREELAADGNVAKYYRIRIRDNGIGFEREKSDKIFDIFQRLHNREEYPGTGIGLAICKRVIQNHKGFIEANGEPDKGAVFTIYLPAND